VEIRLDRTRCKGYGACAEECPSLFELDEFGYAQLKVADGTVPAGDEDAAFAAERGCPERAITTQTD
jgi:ferredoxin